MIRPVCIFVDCDESFSRATIVEDYMLSQVYLRAPFEERLRQEPNPAKREQITRWTSAVPETMLGVLAHLDAQHGGAERYLRAAGMPEAALERLRRRLLVNPGDLDQAADAVAD
ncbi:MAG TPA: tyrosine-protein phosphatase [Roseiflexaceae bacterium]|nr:tyrosine-protein phosphatase [Roseiflexaceae bacterium]